MAGTITICLTQRPDAAGGKLHFYRAGTVSTPQNAYYDSGLTLPLANPYTLDEDGNIPFFFLADGSIKITLIDQHGNNLLSQDNIPVIGSSSGGGGGGTVDPTTVWQTGDLKPRYDTGDHDGWVPANGESIGSATSGATGKASSACESLFLLLYADPNLSVFGGRGGLSAADAWAANKNIATPDIRGRVLAGLDDMGNSAAGRLTVTHFGTSAIVLGATGGAESKTLLTANLPAYTPAGTLAVTAAGTVSAITPAGSVGGTIATTIPVYNNTSVAGSTVTNAVALANSGNASAGLMSVTTGGGASTPSLTFTGTQTTPTFTNSGSSGTFTGTAQGGVSTPFDKTQPTLLVTYYIKL